MEKEGAEGADLSRDYQKYTYDEAMALADVDLIYPDGGEFLTGTISINWNAGDNLDSNPKISIENKHGVGFVFKVNP